MTVFSCGAEPRRTNAEALAACRDLGYLNDGMSIIDLTYGKGRFWNDWMPEGLVGVDINPRRSPQAGVSVDFRATGEEDGRWEASVLDPPYAYRGTASEGMDEDYGIESGMSPKDRDALIAAGIDEAVRITKPKGLVLVKGQDQVVSGKKRWQVRMIANHAEMLGCRLVDILYVRSYRPQPAGRRQVHSASDLSALQVFEVGK